MRSLGPTVSLLTLGSEQQWHMPTQTHQFWLHWVPALVGAPPLRRCRRALKCPDPACGQRQASLLGMLDMEISFDIVLAFCVALVWRPSRWSVRRGLWHWNTAGWERHLTLYKAASKYLKFLILLSTPPSFHKEWHFNFGCPLFQVTVAPEKCSCLS